MGPTYWKKLAQRDLPTTQWPCIRQNFYYCLRKKYKFTLKKLKIVYANNKLRHVILYLKINQVN